MTTCAELLLIEDNPADVELTRLAITEGRLQCNLQVMEDGAAALGYLSECVADAKKLPDLILLDLNMPRMDGAQFIAAMKRKAELRNIPVLLLTGMLPQQYREEYSFMRSQPYLTKPCGAAERTAMISRIGDMLQQAA